MIKDGKVRVDIIESERGWGQRIDVQKDFESFAEADKFVRKYNSKNNSNTVPDWYMYASEPYMVKG